MLFSFFISPVFATEINNPATCDSGTLSTDTGPTNLRANYESNTLNLKWYDENGNQLNVQNESNSCTYGGSINLPTPPTKRGYTFKGWKVAQYDFSTLDADIPGTGYTYNLTTWIVSFPYGDVSGIALCSITAGTYAVAGTPVEGGGGDRKYCWCKATGFKPSSENIVYVPVSSPGWVFRYESVSASDCASDCRTSCGYSLQSSSTVGFRRAVFGITQQ